MLVALAVYCGLTGSASIPGRGGVAAVGGRDAVAVAISLFGASVFLFWHYYVGEESMLYRARDVGRTVGLAGFGLPLINIYSSILFS